MARAAKDLDDQSVLSWALVLWGNKIARRALWTGTLKESDLPEPPRSCRVESKIGPRFSLFEASKRAALAADPRRC